MTTPVQIPRLNLRSGFRARTLAVALVCALTAILTQPTPAQTFAVLHTFTGGFDGYGPLGGVSIDQEGNLYGTTIGSNFGFNYALVYKLANKNGAWILSPLYPFTSAQLEPFARPAIAADHTLYGTTPGGGISCDGAGCGVVYHVAPLPTVCQTVNCHWIGTLIYEFSELTGPLSPGGGDLLLDTAGNIYGTTQTDSNTGSGAVYELSRSGGNWTESTLYFFSGRGGNGDGWYPLSGIIPDSAGNLYGTTSQGGGGNCSGGCGTVYQLSFSGSGWTENIIYRFQGGSDGQFPSGGLVFDQAGNIYGTSQGGANGGGTVFKLTPSGNNWSFSLLYSLVGIMHQDGPTGSLLLDAAGNLYGISSYNGTNGYGAVFKLTPSNGSWIYTSVHDFTGGDDGAYPDGGIVMDIHGNLFGAAYGGGTQQRGTVWEIMP